MHDRIYVFLGPSLPVPEARQLLDATYLPPAAVSDVYALMARRPRTIALIDGVFESVPSVWHKEILFALSQGIRVFGSSSMGALRAAELEPFGMEGVGEIFERYRTGEYEADDEVAVEHATAEYQHRPLSEALVNIRAGLGRARVAGLVKPAIERQIIEALRRTFYPDRSWALVYSIAANAGMVATEVDALREFVRREQPNLKRDDARMLLRRIAEEAARGLTPRPPNFCFEPTTYWRTLKRHVEARQLRGSELSPSAYAGLRDYLRVDAAKYPELLDQALLVELAIAEAERRGITVSAAEIAALEAGRAAAASGVRTPEPRAASGSIRVFGNSTRRPQRLKPPEPPSPTFQRHLEVEVLLHKLRRDNPARVTEWLPLALLRRLAVSGGVGLGARLWQQFHSSEDAMDAMDAMDAPDAAGGCSDREALLAEYEHSAGPAPDGWDRHARALGFADEDAFVAALQRRRQALHSHGVSS